MYFALLSRFTKSRNLRNFSGKYLWKKSCYKEITDFLLLWSAGGRRYLNSIVFSLMKIKIFLTPIVDRTNITPTSLLVSWEPQIFWRVYLELLQPSIPPRLAPFNKQWLTLTVDTLIFSCKKYIYI